MKEVKIRNFMYYQGNHQGGKQASNKPFPSLFGRELNEFGLAEEEPENVGESVVCNDKK